MDIEAFFQHPKSPMKKTLYPKFVCLEDKPTEKTAGEQEIEMTKPAGKNKLPVKRRVQDKLKVSNHAADNENQANKKEERNPEKRRSPGDGKIQDEKKMKMDGQKGSRGNFAARLVKCSFLSSAIVFVALFYSAAIFSILGDFDATEMECV